MEKKTISVHAVTIHAYTIAIVLLIVLLGVLGLKYLHLKLAQHYYMQATMWQNQQQSPKGTISDYASIIATTIAQYPQDKPLITQPLQLESYVTTVSKSLQRDVVVVDTTQKILADTVVGNMGSKYSYDKNSEVALTLKDGRSRSFTETSPDYPQGISEEVVAIKNDKSNIIGAVIISNTQLPQ